MELLLNLAWLLLALPAYWLWRRGERGQFKRAAGSLQCLLALGCALVLLFPVISASDDLHAMRAEMEDSSISKRTVRQACGERHAQCVNHPHTCAALASNAPKLGLPDTGLLYHFVAAVPVHGELVDLHAGRAPPVSLL